jgi:hypothetical protein
MSVQIEWDDVIRGRGAALAAGPVDRHIPPNGGASSRVALASKTDGACDR